MPDKEENTPQNASLITDPGLMPSEEEKEKKTPCQKNPRKGV